MADNAVLILSFDCEGKWGFWDRIGFRHQDKFTNANLNAAYSGILSLLDRHKLAATFGFVGAFTMGTEEYAHVKERVSALGFDNAGPWSAFSSFAARGEFDGWLNPAPIVMVEQAGLHEVACHGFSHISLFDTPVSEETFRIDLKLLSSLSRFRNLDKYTYIYPRNQVKYTEALRETSCIGYRDVLRRAGGKWKGRLSNLRDEFNIFQSSQPHSLPAECTAIPPGYFLNWRSGMRKIVPPGITLNRWKNIINDAVKTGKVVHLWCHPHNFITGHGMFPLFEAILGEAAPHVASGNIINLTQKQYVQWIAKCGS